MQLNFVRSISLMNEVKNYFLLWDRIQRLELRSRLLISKLLHSHLSCQIRWNLMKSTFNGLNMMSGLEAFSSFKDSVSDLLPLFSLTNSTFLADYVPWELRPHRIPSCRWDKQQRPISLNRKSQAPGCPQGKGSCRCPRTQPKGWRGVAPRC